jgi:hypothetical protein
VRWLFVVAVLVACNGKEAEVAPPPGPAETIGKATPGDVLEGDLAVGGERVKLVACKPGHTDRVFVEVVTSKGKLRFHAMHLYWNQNPEGDRGVELVCPKLDRSWGGGIRRDGTAYWRGTLDFVCGDIGGKLNLDCGGITKEERASLDESRQEMKEQQKR